MFFGGGSGARGVNLGGRSAKKANDLVDQSKRGREERELLRKREASAKKIQSAFRAFRQLRVTQRQVQSSWILKDLNLATFTRDNLAQAIREYLFFRPSAPNDFTSLDRILTFLSISVAVNDPLKNIMSLVFSSEPYRFIVSIRKFLAQCVKTIANSNYRKDTILLLLGILTSQARYEKVKPDTESLLTSESAVQSIVSYLCSHGILKVLATILKDQVSNQQTGNKDDVIGTTVTLITSFFRQEWAVQVTKGSLSAVGASLSASILVGILSLPLPTSVVESNAPLRPAVVLALDYFDYIMSSPKWDFNNIVESNVARTLSLLENIALVMEAFSDAVDPTSLGKFMMVISELSGRVYHFTKSLRENALAADSIVDRGTDDMEVDVMEVVPQGESARLIDLAESISASLAIQLERLFQRPSFQQLCSKLNGDSSTSSMTSFLGISKLVRIASAVVPDQHLVVQVYEALSGPLVPLWASVKEQIKMNSVTMSEQTRNLIGLFCRSYTFLLQDVLDDSEFFDKQTPFSLHAIIEMIQLLKALVAHRLQTASPANSDWGATLEDIHLLLVQLQRKNWRREFVQPTAFFIQSLTADELANGDSLRHPAVRHCPVVISTAEKVKLFHYWIARDKANYQPDVPSPEDAVMVRVARNRLLRDAYSSWGHGGSDLKKQVKVEFVSADGIPEAGIDGGGLFRELVSKVVAEGFSPDFGLFTTTPENTLYPRPDASVIHEDAIRYYEFVGRVLGKCVYELVLVDVSLAQFFVSKILNHRNHVADLRYLDRAVYNNLMALKNMNDPQQIQELWLTFTAEKTGTTDGDTTPYELLPGGANINVTSENKMRYIRHFADFKLNNQIEWQSEAFLRGFSDLIDRRWISIFAEEELVLNISGAGSRIDIQDLKNNCKYSGGFHESHPTIRMLWEVLETLDDKQHGLFLKFVTSHSRPPVLGFQTLVPKFCVQRKEGGDEYLPSCNTCMHLFKLPAYTTKDKLKEKLLYAIQADAGFELS